VSNEHVNTTVRSILDTICPPVERDMLPIAAAIAPLATMGQPVKPVAPVTVEVSDDENTVTVTRRFRFVEAYADRCTRCAANRSDELCELFPPCVEMFRKDQSSGYFREVRG
jgi:hypothetical protein